MTAPTITAPQLALARNAAQAALAVLPTSRELAVAARSPRPRTSCPRARRSRPSSAGRPTARSSWWSAQDLADALKESPLGELDLTAAVRPALEAAARVFGPVVLDPGS
jgi:flagellar motor switch protein FliN/FliY